MASFKITAWAETDIQGSRVESEQEVDDLDFDGLTPEEKEQEIQDIARELAFDMIEWGGGRDES